MTTNLTPAIVDGPIPAGPKGDTGIRIRGAWTTGMSCAKDDLVLRFNSIWIANVNTTVAPSFNDVGGSASADWTMAVDGRGTELASDAAAAAVAARDTTLAAEGTTIAARDDATATERRIRSQDLGDFADDASALAWAAAQSPAISVVVGSSYWNTTTKIKRICSDSTTTPKTFVDEDADAATQRANAATSAAAAAGSKAALDAKWGGVLSAHPTNDASGAAVQNGLAYYSSSASRLFARVAGSFTALVNAILTVSGAPSSGTGYDGDFAIDPTARMLYSKAGGAWTGVSLAGDQGPPAFRNRLINGNFDIWQRGTSFAVADSSWPYLADRWTCWNNAGVTATVSKVAAPTGFAGAQALNYAATGVAATKEFWLLQRIEAQMLADLDGKAVVLSFDMKGTTSAGDIYGVVAIRSNTDVDDGTYPNSLYWTSISVSSASTRVSIAIPAANTAGLKNGAIVEIVIVQAGATGNHDITIGAVQFEADRQIAGAWNNPTAFEFRPPPLELALCQRYYYRRAATGAYDAIGQVTAYGPSSVYGKLFDLPVEMRSYNATITASSASHFSVYDSTVTPYVVSGFGPITANKRSLSLSGGVTVSGSPGFTAGQALTMIFNSSSGWIAIDTEL